jgi:4-hydroxy-tetrahydrodipicolinate synthase
MSLQTLLRGTGVALVTPFNVKGEVDFDAFGRVIDYVIEDKVEYVVVLGTTGEAPVLTKEEKIEVVKYTYQKVHHRVPVIVGIGSNDTAYVLNELETLPLDESVAVLSASPYYNKPSQEGLFQHYKMLAKASPKPILLYNVPGRTGRNLESATTIRIANEVENVIGIKEASGDMTQCMKILRDRPKNFLVVSGDDNLALPQLACGMDGVISVAANCVPALFSAMVRSCLAGDFLAARHLNDPMMDVYDMLFAENNPAGVKAFLAAEGLIGNHLRLPNVPVSEQLYLRIAEYVRKKKIS